MTIAKSKVGLRGSKPAKSKAKPDELNPNALHLVARKGVSREYLKAETIFHPLPRHAAMGKMFAEEIFDRPSETTVNDGVAVLRAACDSTRAGDLGQQRDMLTAQAFTLDGMFTEMARRVSINFGHNVEVVDRFMRLALKAQAQSRATIETLDRLVRGGEQVVRHIHVDNRGGQAVIAETVNTGGYENGDSVKQSDATTAIGGSTALPGSDPQELGMRFSSGERQAALQDARWNESGSAERQL